MGICPSAHQSPDLQSLWSLGSWQGSVLMKSFLYLFLPHFCDTSLAKASPMATPGYVCVLVNIDTEMSHKKPLIK